jgi:hypothetical protein
LAGGGRSAGGLVMGAPGTLPDGWACFRNRRVRLRKLWRRRCPLCRERVTARRVLLPSRHYRCSCCMVARPIRSWWCCGLLVTRRGGWHERHRWRWSMRVCQYLHGLDVNGRRKHGSDGL